MRAPTQEKCKYELITGQWKSTDEVISIYTDLLASNPGLMGYIDPLHHKDVEGWRKLQDALGNKCLLVADRTLAQGLPVASGTESTKEESNDRELASNGDEETAGLDFLSCVSLSLEKTLSATFSRSLALRGSANYTMLSVPPTLAVNPAPVDAAVAMQCTLLRLGAPCGLTSSCLLSRILQIRDELSSKGIYEPAKALVFSSTSLSQLDQQ
jgi:hypothetical protein